jgi:hypothetical protein
MSVSSASASRSNSSSPEKYCLGELMKDIDKDSPREYDFDSKDETAYKTLDEHKLSLDSFYSFKSSKNNFLFSQSLENKNVNNFPIFSLSSILSAFNNQKTTINLQKSLKGMSKDILNGLIKEMKGFFSIIIKNKNGNYFCSDLFKACDKEQRIEILKEITNNLSDDCIDEFGTHPIQTLMELAECEDEYKLLLNSFYDYNKVLKATSNQNGTYVIQKLIVHIPEKFRINFNLIFLKLICILSMDMYGVCTVIKFIEHTKNEIIEKQLLNLILSNFVNIAENQYGNYLIQNVLRLWWDTDNGKFLKKICMDKFHKLARNHYSSYVCDVFLKLSNLEDKKLLMSTLINCKTIGLFNKNNCGKIIINKLINELKKQNIDNNNIKVIQKDKKKKDDFLIKKAIE